MEGSLVPAKLSQKEQSRARWSRVEQFKVVMPHEIEPVEHSNLEKNRCHSTDYPAFGGFVHNGFHCLRLGDRSTDCRKCPPSFLHLEKPHGAGHGNGHGPGFVLAAMQN